MTFLSMKSHIERLGSNIFGKFYHQILGKVKNSHDLSFIYTHILGRLEIKKFGKFCHQILGKVKKSHGLSFLETHIERLESKIFGKFCHQILGKVSFFEISYRKTWKQYFW